MGNYTQIHCDSISTIDSKQNNTYTYSDRRGQLVRDELLYIRLG